MPEKLSISRTTHQNDCLLFEKLSRQNDCSPKWSFGRSRKTKCAKMIDHFTEKPLYPRSYRYVRLNIACRSERMRLPDGFLRERLNTAGTRSSDGLLQVVRCFPSRWVSFRPLSLEQEGSFKETNAHNIVFESKLRFCVLALVPVVWINKCYYERGVSRPPARRRAPNSN